MNADLAARSVRSRHRDRGRSQRQRQADHSGDAVLRQHHFFTEQRSPARQVRPSDVRMSPSSRPAGQSSQGQPAGSLHNHPAHRTDSRPAWLLEQATGMDSLPRNQGSRSTGITFNRDHVQQGSRGTGITRNRGRRSRVACSTADHASSGHSRSGHVRAERTMGTGKRSDRERRLHALNNSCRGRKGSHSPETDLLSSVQATCWAGRYCRASRIVSQAWERLSA